MRDAAFVRRGQTAQDARGQIERLAHGERSGVNPLAERRADEELRHDIRGAPVVADVIERDDVGMVQGGGGACFLLEAGDAIRIADGQLREHLDGDFAVQPGVDRAIDFAHSACAKPVGDPIRTEGRARGERHVGVAIVPLSHDSLRSQGDRQRPAIRRSRRSARRWYRRPSRHASRLPVVPSRRLDKADRAHRRTGHVVTND